MITDSPYRWQEIISSQNKTNGIIAYNWDTLCNCINSFEYFLDTRPDIILEFRASGKLGKLRKAIREIHCAVQESVGKAKDDSFIERLKKQFIDAYNAGNNELKKVDQYSFKGKFHYIIPTGGIVHNNVQRMLLSSGIDNHLPKVPMAIFMETIENS